MRPAQTTSPPPPIRIGIDFGGTKIEAVAIDRHGRERVRKRVLTPVGDYRASLRAIADLVEHVHQLTRPCDAPDAGRAAPVGVGIPGAVSPHTGLVKNANSTWLIGKPLHRDLAALLGRPVRVENDANCFVRSEARDGAGQGAPVVFGVILGTGVGGGVAVGGRALAGPNAVAGEWGHNPLPWPTAGETPGPRCYCGKAGCIETFLSGPALARDSGLDDGVHDGKAPAGDAAAVFAAAESGSEEAERAVRRYEDRLARALAAVINLLDPDCIVLGGGVSNAERLYRNVPARWGRYVFSDHIATPLRRAVHGDSSGVRGAAWLWP